MSSPHPSADPGPSGLDAMLASGDDVALDRALRASTSWTPRLLRRALDAPERLAGLLANPHLTVGHREVLARRVRGQFEEREGRGSWDRWVALVARDDLDDATVRRGHAAVDRLLEAHALPEPEPLLPLFYHLPLLAHLVVDHPRSTERVFCYVAAGVTSPALLRRLVRHEPALGRASVRRRLWRRAEELPARAGAVRLVVLDAAEGEEFADYFRAVLDTEPARLLRHLLNGRSGAGTSVGEEEVSTMLQHASARVRALAVRWLGRSGGGASGEA